MTSMRSNLLLIALVCSLLAIPVVTAQAAISFVQPLGTSLLSTTNGNGPVGLAAGDFDGDGIVDLAGVARRRPPCEVPGCRRMEYAIVPAISRARAGACADWSSCSSMTREISRRSCRPWKMPGRPRRLPLPALGSGSAWMSIFRLSRDCGAYRLADAFSLVARTRQGLGEEARISHSYEEKEQ